MARDDSLLVMAAVLQDYLVDKDDGLPLAAGIVTLYEEDQRSILKNWYTQQGTNPPYTFVALPNPMTLSSVGTIQDADGNDVIPFFYPYDESEDVPVVQTYSITVHNADGELQFTRSNFPYTPGGSSSGTVIPTNQNLISNSGFWRNIAANAAVDTTGVDSILINSITLNGSSINYAVIAPSQHDGFTMPDILYFKNANDGTEEISFNNFVTDDQLTGDPTPQYYLDLDCTVAGTESQKFIQIPLMSSIFSLSGFLDSTVTLQAINFNPGSPITITVGILQYLGSGVNSDAVAQTSIELASGWTKSSISLPIPSAEGQTVSGAGDDGLYLRIGIQVQSALHIGIAVPSFYLAEIAKVPTNSFQTNDQVNSIISSPRTGDVRIAHNRFVQYGWAAMNDGTISLNPLNVAPGGIAASRENVDTWQLFNLLWTIASPFSVGTTNPICQLWSNVGAQVAYGASAYADFVTNNRALQLTKMMGRVLMGTVPLTSLLEPTYYQAFTTSANVCTTGGPTPNGIYNGLPITLQDAGSLPSPLVEGVIYYVSAFNGANAFSLSTTYANAIQGTVITFGAGGGTFVYAPSGTSGGEYSHLPTIAEMAAHDHPGSNFATTTFVPGGGGLASYYSGASGTSLITVNTQGGGQRFNITQPQTFANIYIKL